MAEINQYRSCDCPGCEFRSVVFQNLTNNEIGVVCQTKTDAVFEKGEIIVEEGQKIGEFLYLKSGLVKLYKNGPDGKDQIISIAKPFDFVSLLSVFSDTHYNYAISALERSTVCKIDLLAIRELIRKNGEFGLDIMEKMSKSSDKIIKSNIELNSKQLRGRIAYIIQYFADEIYGSCSFEIPVSRKEIAQLIDMTTENVIRIFSEFRKDNIIRINGKMIEIVNREMLDKIALHG